MVEKVLLRICWNQRVSSACFRVMLPERVEAGSNILVEVKEIEPQPHCIVETRK